MAGTYLTTAVLNTTSTPSDDPTYVQSKFNIPAYVVQGFNGTNMEQNTWGGLIATIKEKFYSNNIFTAPCDWASIPQMSILAGFNSNLLGEEHPSSPTVGLQFKKWTTNSDYCIFWQTGKNPNKTVLLNGKFTMASKFEPDYDLYLKYWNPLNALNPNVRDVSSTVGSWSKFSTFGGSDRTMSQGGGYPYPFLFVTEDESKAFLNFFYLPEPASVSKGDSFQFDCSGAQYIEGEVLYGLGGYRRPVCGFADYSEITTSTTPYLYIDVLETGTCVLNSEVPGQSSDTTYETSGGYSYPSNGAAGGDDWTSTNHIGSLPHLKEALNNLPTVSATSLGLVTLYSPSINQLNTLGRALWTTDFIINVKKLWASPMDAILGLTMVPFTPTTSSTTSAVFCGNVELEGVSMKKITNQYKIVDCGTIAIKPINGWGALNYSPYTKVQLYLPFVGFRQLDTDEVMGQNLRVVYKIDVLSGAFVANMSIGSKDYQSFSGNCSAQIPVTAGDYSNAVRNAISVAATIGAGAVSGGLGAGVGINAIASTVSSSKQTIQKVGCVGGMSGFLGYLYPFVLIERPKQCIPEYKGHYVGYPSKMRALLATVKGFTVVEKINLDGTGASSAEMDEITSLLKGGVIF